jgi:hypothetical protein
MAIVVTVVPFFFLAKATALLSIVDILGEHRGGLGLKKTHEKAYMVAGMEFLLQNQNRARVAAGFVRGQG